MSHCRWVVIAEDCYEELKNQSSSTAVNKNIASEKKSDPISETRPESSQDWTAALPPSFRNKAQEFLNNLITYSDFSISSTGHVILNDKITNYHIEQLLRTAFVPYNNTQFPIDVQEWLRKHNLTEFPNPLAVIRPQWKSAFTLRRSSRIEQAVQSRPFTNKRKKMGRKT